MRPIPTAEMLRARLIERSERVTESGCWLWIGSLQVKGYGITSRGRNKPVLTHRLSYEVFVGEIPPETLVCHRCDVRCCVNPSHLFLGSPHDNTRDAMRKGRLKPPPHNTGEFHWNWKGGIVSARYKRIIELMMRTEGCTTQDLVAEFGVTLTRARGLVKYLRRTSPSLFQTERKHLGRGRGMPSVHFIR